MKVICPKCGNPGYFVEDKRELKSKDQVYYFVVHRYKDSSGRWRSRKCSIGAEEYIYVTKTHVLPAAGVTLMFSSVAETERLAKLCLRVLREFENHLVSMDPDKVKDSVKLEEYIENISKHVENIKKIYAKLVVR